MTRPEQALLPCPHCNSTRVQVMHAAEVEKYDVEYGGPWPHSDSYTVVCSVDDEGCGAVGGYMGTVEEAIAQWNRREALLSRAATTQAVTRQFFEDDEGDIYELIGSTSEGGYFMRHFANDDRDWVESEQFGKMKPLYPSHVAPVVADGWKLVPIEPTDAMKEAWAQYKRDCNEQGIQRTAGGHYRAMIAAAPAQPQPSGCQACKTVAHASDCAVHNAPASANGPCDCGAMEPTAADWRRMQQVVRRAFIMHDADQRELVCMLPADFADLREIARERKV